MIARLTGENKVGCHTGAVEKRGPEPLKDEKYKRTEPGVNYIENGAGIEQGKGPTMGATAKRLKSSPAQRTSVPRSAEERLAERVSAVIEAQVKKMTPEEVRRADAELHKIATRVRATSGTR